MGDWCASHHSKVRKSEGLTSSVKRSTYSSSWVQARNCGQETKTGERNDDDLNLEDSNEVRNGQDNYLVVSLHKNVGKGCRPENEGGPQPKNCVERKCPTAMRGIGSLDRHRTRGDLPANVPSKSKVFRTTRTRACCSSRQVRTVANWRQGRGGSYGLPQLFRSTEDTSVRRRKIRFLVSHQYPVLQRC